MPFEPSIDQKALHKVNAALASEADGKKLKRQLSKELKAVLEPAKSEVISGLMSVGGAEPAEGEPLRAAVAAGIKIDVRYSGRQTGVRLRARKTPATRGFANAARRLNAKKGWRHPVYGNTEVWVQQTGNPGYWDDPLDRRQDDMRKAALKAGQDMLRRIASRAKST